MGAVRHGYCMVEGPKLYKYKTSVPKAMLWQTHGDQVVPAFHLALG